MEKKILEDYKFNVKLKLSLLWATLMFLYIYADYFELMTPGKLQSMINLKTAIGPTTPNILVSFSVLLIIPALMIVSSIFLRPILSKWLNIVFGVLYALISILIIKSGLGNKWQSFFVLYNLVELFVLLTILWQSWRWPKQASVTNTH